MDFSSVLIHADRTAAAKAARRGAAAFTEDGPVLREDLAFLFEHLGVYGIEANRALNILTRMEAGGLSVGRVRGEIHRLREIIDLGYDPNNPIQPRRDFNDRLFCSVEGI